MRLAFAAVPVAGSDIQTGNNGDSINSIVIASGSATDVDGDGLPDAWETADGHGLDPLNGDEGPLDPDGDSWTNLTEFAQGTHPNVADTDDDSIDDNVDPEPLFNPAWISPVLQLLY